MTDKINVAYTVDIQGLGAVPFANQLLTSLYSLKTSNGMNNICVWVFFGKIDDAYIRTLNMLKCDGFDIKFRSIPQSDLEYMQKFSKQNPMSQQRSWCGVVYARLWLAKYLEKESRCLYLDADTMIRSDISDLYATDMSGKTYGMAMGCIPEYGYNSGVILMDLEGIRKANKWDGLKNHLEKYSKTYYLPDQTTINRFYKDDIFEIPMKYNYPPFMDRTGMPNDDCSTAVIWHFYNGGTKPMMFMQADWCKVEWNNKLIEANKSIRTRMETTKN